VLAPFWEQRTLQHTWHTCLCVPRCWLRPQLDPVYARRSGALSCGPGTGDTGPDRGCGPACGERAEHAAQRRRGLCSPDLRVDRSPAASDRQPSQQQRSRSGRLRNARQANDRCFCQRRPRRWLFMVRSAEASKCGTVSSSASLYDVAVLQSTLDTYVTWALDSAVSKTSLALLPPV